MANTLGNLKLALKRLAGIAMALFVLLAVLLSVLDAQEPTETQEQLPRYATWRFGEFGEAVESGDGVYRISYSPDGRYLAARSKNNVVAVYDLKTRSAICEVEGHENRIASIDFSPDGEFFVTASGAGEKIKIWKTQTGGLQSEIESGGGAAYFDRSGKQINALGETHVQFYSWPGVQLTGQRKWKGSNETARAMSRDGRFVVAFRSLNKQFYETLMIDTESKSKVPLAGATAVPRTVRVSPDNQWIVASYNRDPKIRLWATADPKNGRYTLNGHTETVQSLSFSPDNRFLVSSGWDQTVIAWDLLTRQKIRKLEGHQAHVNATAWAPLSFSFASGASGIKDCSLITWDIDEILFPAHNKPDLDSELSVAQQFDPIWKSLGASSLRLSMRATSKLAAGGDYFLDSLEKKIRGTISVDRSASTENYIKQLDDPDYEVRQKATEALLKIVNEIEAKLREQLKQTSSPEVKYRISSILKQDPPRAPSDVVVTRRWSRIVLALEKIHTERSQAMLKAISLGHRDSEIASGASESFHRNNVRQQMLEK